MSESSLNSKLAREIVDLYGPDDALSLAVRHHDARLMLHAVEREILHDRVLELRRAGLSLQVIGDRLGKSKQWVSWVISKRWSKKER